MERLERLQMQYEESYSKILNSELSKLDKFDKKNNQYRTNTEKYKKLSDSDVIKR